MIRKLLIIITQKLGMYQYAVKTGTKLIHKKQGRNLKKYGLETLIQADKALKSFDSICFMVFGTLLGAYREKNFIAHDFDLDVGILADNRPKDFPEILKKYGFKPVRQYYIKETQCPVIETYSYKNVHIDFFTYFTKDKYLYCYFAKKHEYLTHDEANKANGFPAGICWSENIGFSKMDFLGYDFYAPANIEQWLTDVYGKSFMQPRKDWISSDHISEENLNLKYIKERLYRNNF